MGLPTQVSFRSSQSNATAMLAAAPQKAEAARGQERFERHLDDSRPHDTQAADRRADRRAERRERDRSSDDRARTEDTQKADSDTVPQTDAEAATSDTTDAIAAMVDAPVVKADTPKAITTDTADETTDAEAAAPTDILPLAADKAQDDKAETTPDLVAAAAKETDTATKADVSKDAKPEQASADLAALATAPAANQSDTRKTDVKAPKAETKSAAAPVPASQAPLAAAVNAAPVAEAQKPVAQETDPDAGLTISSKEGLGHEAAAKMAENKTDTKAGPAQQTAPNAQAASSTAAAANATTQNFAKMVAAASGGEVTSVSSTGTGTSSSLSDLQNVSGTTQSQTGASATVRIGTLPGQSTPTQVPSMAIALQVARNLQKGINRFDIRLDPAEMGRIDVRMEVKRDGNVTAHMIVERPETLDLLRRDASALHQALNDAGLQADADSLNFSLRDEADGSNAQAFNDETRNAGSSGTGEVKADEGMTGPVYNVNLSANGGIDIRV
tara:strand:- start:707 stop:2212 length:1506 start_codon:yes stop_codon:yes gene_type:complete